MRLYRMFDSVSSKSIENRHLRHFKHIQYNLIKSNLVYKVAQLSFKVRNKTW